VGSLRESLPDLFAELAQGYGDLIERALEQRHYKVTHPLSEELRDLSERLGVLKAGPRHVIEIHHAVLTAKRQGAPPARVQAYLEEGRLLLLELLGDLVSYYRRYSLGAGRASRPADSPPQRGRRAVPHE
jgi:hypothetical protein